jgi:hypothetical protein
MRMVVVVTLFLGLVYLFPASAIDGTAHSPVGIWEVDLSGSDRGITYLTFSTNFTWTGYGISLESFGPISIVGTWTNETFPGATVPWHMAAKLPGGKKFRGTADSTFDNRHPHLNLRGKTAASTHNISGTWVAEGRSGGDVFSEIYTLTASTNMANWFDLAGQVSTGNGTSTVSGAVILSPDRRASGYMITDFSSSVTVTSSFRGRFNPPMTKITFVGRDDNNRSLVIRATQQ